MLDEIIRKRKKFENEIIKIGNFIIKNRKKMYVTKLNFNPYAQLFHRGDGKLDPVPNCGVGFFLT